MQSVLVLDDDVNVRRIVRVVLRQEGYDVVEAGNGEDALACLDGDTPAMIVLDLNMPGMDGETFYRIARAQGYLRPVLLLSAYGVYEAQRRLHADDALAKPFDPDILAGKVHQLTDS